MIVDWLSFTVEVEPVEEFSHAEKKMRHELWRVIQDENPVLAQAIERMDTLQPGSGRSPYNVSWHTSDGLTVFANPKLPHALVEFSGKGCAWLRSQHMFTGMLAFAEQRITRLDLAIDLPGVTPSQIVGEGFSGRFRSTSDIRSETGHTIYIGSTKSDRYARVYKYSKPHPRHRLCRIEAVHRAKYARDVARDILDKGTDQAGRERIAAYKFEHEDVKAFVDGAKPPPTTPIEKDSAKTERWLIAQAAPAFRKLVMSGVIGDPIDWLNNHFLQHPGD